jgi:hypothetical protein
MQLAVRGAWRYLRGNPRNRKSKKHRQHNGQKKKDKLCTLMISEWEIQNVDVFWNVV